MRWHVFKPQIYVHKMLCILCFATPTRQDFSLLKVYMEPFHFPLMSASKENIETHIFLLGRP